MAIDSAKRSFDVDVSSEIKRLKRELNVCDSNGDGNLYPKFWKTVQPQWNQYKTITIKDEDENTYIEQRSLINTNLECPMNYIDNFRIRRYINPTQTISNDEFFVNYELKESRRKCKKIESIIEKYSIKVLNTSKSSDTECDDFLLLRDDFDELIEDIRRVHISNNYLGLMSYLINRALFITPGAKRQMAMTQSNLNKNRSLLMKTLYTVSPRQFLQCFSKKRTLD